MVTKQQVLVVITVLSWTLLGAFGDSVYLPFMNDEIVDYPIVRVTLGNPQRVYTLRVAFSTSTYPLCALNPSIVLYQSQEILKKRSNTFETRIPSLLGRDFIEVTGSRYWGTIITAPDGAFLSVGDGDPGQEGVLCLSSAASAWPWSQAFADRHGIWLSSDVPTALHESVTPLQPVGHTSIATSLPVQSVLNAAIGCAWFTQRFGANGTDQVRICAVPDVDATFVPNHLFQRYFGEFDLYTAERVDPRSWQPLVFEFQPPGRGAPLERIFVAGHQILPLLDGVASINIANLQASASEVAGVDTLKMLPHELDNTTVLLGGHILWASTRLYIQWPSGSPMRVIAIKAQLTEYMFTAPQAFFFILAVILHLRWKLASQTFESRVDIKSGIVCPDISVQSEVGDLYWPLVLPLWLAPVVFIWRASSLVERIDQWDVQLALAATFIVYTFLAVALLVVDGAQIVRASRIVVRGLRKRFSQKPMRWIAYVIMGEGESEAGTKEPSVLSLDSVAYETSLIFVCARNTAVDMLMSLTAWALLAFLESRIFSLPILFAVLCFLVLCCAYNAFIVLFITLWPIVLSRRHYGRVLRSLRSGPLEWLALGFTLLGSVISVYLLISAAMRPLFVNLSSVYGADDQTLVVVSLLLVSILFFFATLVSDTTIQAQLLDEHAKDIAAHEKS